MENRLGPGSKSVSFLPAALIAPTGKQLFTEAKRRGPEPRRGPACLTHSTLQHRMEAARRPLLTDEISVSCLHRTSGSS